MISALSIVLLLSSAHASSEAEVNRLSEEMNRLAQKTAWSGVERKYNEVVLLKRAVVPGAVHLLGAQAARQRGDVAEAHARAQRALQSEVLEPETLQEASAWLSDFLVNYGEVKIELSVAFRGQPSVHALDGAGFSPKVRDQIAIVDKRLTQERAYTGFLPLGRYKIGDTFFDIFGGPQVKVFVKPAKDLPDPSQSAPVDLPDERPPDRIITLAVRGGGWTANTWTAVASSVRDALYDVEGVMTVDSFSPDEHWVVTTPDPAKLEHYGLDNIQLASTLQLALDVHRVVVVSDALAFPPGTAEASALESAIVAFEPGDDPSLPPTPVTLASVASIGRPATGPFPVPPDSGPIAQHRFEVKVRGGSSAVEHLMRAIDKVEGVEALGLMMEAQEVR